MKPKLLNQIVPTNAANEEIVVYDGDTGYKIKKSSITLTDLQETVNNTAPTKEHMGNGNIHLTPIEKTTVIDGINTSTNHIADVNLHVSATDRSNWDGKETVTGAQAKADAVKANLTSHINDGNTHVTIEERNRWNNTYTQADVDNKIAAVTGGLEWKAAVPSYSKISSIYPNPEDGWTVTALDDDITYRYNGIKWIAISANSIPIATSELDGKMSKDDKAKLDTVDRYANYYVHPSDSNTKHVSDDDILNWNNKASTAVATTTYNGLMSSADKIKLNNLSEHPASHPAAMIEEDSSHRFVTDIEKSTWNAKASTAVATTTTNGLMSSGDKIKLNGLVNYTHPSTHPASMIVTDSTRSFITETERSNWNDKAPSTMASTIANGLMSKEDKIKLTNISEYANKNIQVDWSVTDTGSDAYIKNKPTSLPANGGTASAANKLTSSRTISLIGDVTGTVSFDGSADASMKTTIDSSANITSKIKLTGYSRATTSSNINVADTINAAIGKLEKRVYDVESEIANAITAVNQITALLA